MPQLKMRSVGPDRKKTVDDVSYPAQLARMRAVFYFATVAVVVVAMIGSATYMLRMPVRD